MTIANSSDIIAIMSKAKLERNKKILEDKESGKYNMAQLVSMYKISPNAIYGILQRLKISEKH